MGKNGKIEGGIAYAHLWIHAGADREYAAGRVRSLCEAFGRARAGEAGKGESGGQREGSRGVEYDLLPWLEEHQIPLMAYCPLAQAGDLQKDLLKSSTVKEIAKDHNITPMQVLLAFVLYQPNVIAIPRSGKAEHVLQNWNARKIRLTDVEYGLLDKAFPAPKQKTYLDIV